MRRIAAISGVPVRSQQHWASLGRHFACAAGATLTAWLSVHYLFASAPLVVRLAVGAGVLGALYGAVNWKHRR